jgi:hypothetical protein
LRTASCRTISTFSSLRHQKTRTFQHSSSDSSNSAASPTRRITPRRSGSTGIDDRILRDDEATTAVARYVLENPVRAGLARRVGEYPFAGSDVYDLRGLLTLWEEQT